MKVILIILLLTIEFSLFGQDYEIKPLNNKIVRDYKRRLYQSLEIIRVKFGTNSIDGIVKYRFDLSSFKDSFISHSLDQDSVKKAPDEYTFSYDFFRGNRLVDNLGIRITSAKKLQISINRQIQIDLDGILLVITGSTKIPRDSIERISQAYYPNVKTLIQLENNYEPFNDKKPVRFYWTIKKINTINDERFEFLKVDLLTGEVERMISASDTKG